VKYLSGVSSSAEDPNSDILFVEAAAPAGTLNTIYWSVFLMGAVLQCLILRVGGPT